jgi:predicted lysophospholipase L1 biosynthesis ABC-type transport system permease subunit
MEIVGIVEDIKEGAIDKPTAPTMYVAFAQDPTGGFALVVRSAQSQPTLLPSLAAAIHEIDPDISTFGGRTVREIIDNSQAAYLRRSSAALVGAFAAAAWLLGIVGLYGIVAYSVSQRTREIGVRIALGAQRRSVYQLILHESSWLITGGIALGLACAVGAATFLRGLLFGVSAWDAPTLTASPPRWGHRRSPRATFRRGGLHR